MKQEPIPLICSNCESYRLQLLSILKEKNNEVILNLLCLSCGFSCAFKLSDVNLKQKKKKNNSPNYAG